MRRFGLNGDRTFDTPNAGSLDTNKPASKQRDPEALPLIFAVKYQPSLKVCVCVCVCVCVEEAHGV